MLHPFDNRGLEGVLYRALVRARLPAADAGFREDPSSTVAGVPPIVLVVRLTRQKKE